MNRKTLQCCGIKQYTQTEKLQQIGQIKNKKEKTCLLIDVAIPTGRNFVQKGADKRPKYKRLCTETQRTCHQKNKTVPAINGTTEILTKVFKKNLEAIPGKYSTDSLQKTSILFFFKKGIYWSDS
jgi:hypothetical protein